VEAKTFHPSLLVIKPLNTKSISTGRQRFTDPHLHLIIPSQLSTGSTFGTAQDSAALYFKNADY
jgi:hypothetical protein